MTLRRFYAPKAAFSGREVTLDADESKHLRDVLRLKAGDEIAVFDGGGGEYLCRVELTGKSGSTASVLRQIEPSAPESPLDLTLASVVIPGDKYDLIVQKAVELGVNRFIPLSSKRAETKLKDLPKKLTRWRRIALDAAKQCGRARLMSIEEPRAVIEIVNSNAETTAAKIFFSERSGGQLPNIQTPPSILAVIGPKGGWDDAELAAAERNGFTIVTLGGRIMRAETAAIALTAILQHRFGDIS